MVEMGPDLRRDGDCAEPANFWFQKERNRHE
jgi:hypothetical protein